MDEHRIQYADDATENVSLLLRLRLPWLLIGVLLAAAMTVLVSRFEAVLAEDLRLAFFIPLVVYLSGAVATQTEAIYIENLAKGQPRFTSYLAKEILLGLLFGAFFGILLGVLSLAWLGSPELALTVTLSVFGSVASATILALFITGLLRREHRDPALGAGPFTAIVQDIVSVAIFFLVASVLIT